MENFEVVNLPYREIKQIRFFGEIPKTLIKFTENEDGIGPFNKNIEFSSFSEEELSFFKKCGIMDHMKDGYTYAINAGYGGISAEGGKVSGRPYVWLRVDYKW